MQDEPIKKGSRVCFPIRGTDGTEVLHGVVSRMQKGKGKATVIVDGGRSSCYLPLTMLKHSDRPLPKDPPHPMDRWAVRNYKEHAADVGETVALLAVVTLDGKDVFIARNDGRGGCNRYDPTDLEGPKLREFQAAAEQWASDHGYDGLMEPEDAWLTWKAQWAAYGMTAKDFLEEMKQEIEALSGPKV